MDDFKEQYQQELVHQEVKSNIYILKSFIWFLLALGFMWLLTVVGFFEIDKKMISIALVCATVLLAPSLFLFYKGDLSKPWYKFFFLSLVCVASSMIVSFLSYHAVLLYVVPLLFAIQYRRRSTIWFVYVVNTVTMLISSIVSFYYGICDLNLLLQSQHVRSWYLDIITEDALHIPFNENPLFIIVVFEVFPRSIILFVFSILMQYTVVSSKEDAYRIAQLTYLKETDTSTRVFNKNKYEEMIAQYYPNIAQIAVIFWDVNNLKMTNDRYGHAVGDQVIERLSSALYRRETDRRRVYRVGGDEFVMIIDNPNVSEAENIIQDVHQTIEKENENSKVKLSSAAGYAIGSGQDIIEVVKRADADMYENKKRSKESRRS